MMPAACSCRINGIRFAANASACAFVAAVPLAAASAR